MEKISKETVRIGNIIRITGETALIEGTAKLQSENAELSSVLECSALAEVLSASAGEGSAGVEGKARFSVVYLDKTGDIRSFDNECSFLCNIENSSVVSGMTVLPSVSVLECSAKPADGGVFMRALINIELCCVKNTELEAVTEETAEGLETLVMEASVPEVLAAKTAKLYVNAETSPCAPCREVLLSRAYCILRKLTCESGKLVLEGDIRFSALYIPDDASQPFLSYEETLPFGEILQEDACIGDEIEVYADLKPERLGAEHNGEGFAVSAVIGVSYVITKPCRRRFVSDLYSPLFECVPKSRRIDCSTLVLKPPAKRLMRLSLKVPDSYPAAARVISSSATAQISSVSPGDTPGKLGVTGVIAANLCYSTADAGIRSIRQNLPFEAEIPGGSENEVTPYAEYVEAECVGDEIELKVSMEFTVTEKNSESFDILTDLEIDRSAPVSSPGIVIYYPDSGEKLWDAAKRFRCDTDVLLRENGLEREALTSRAEKKLFIIHG